MSCPFPTALHAASGRQKLFRGELVVLVLTPFRPCLLLPPAPSPLQAASSSFPLPLLLPFWAVRRVSRLSASCCWKKNERFLRLTSLSINLSSSVPSYSCSFPSLPQSIQSQASSVSSIHQRHRLLLGNRHRVRGNSCSSFSPSSGGGAARAATAAGFCGLWAAPVYPPRLRGGGGPVRGDASASAAGNLPPRPR